jgi:hypothetical protein
MAKEEMIEIEGTVREVLRDRARQEKVSFQEALATGITIDSRKMPLPRSVSSTLRRSSSHTSAASS